jgi:hypothetical protein
MYYLIEQHRKERGAPRFDEISIAYRRLVPITTISTCRLLGEVAMIIARFDRGRVNSPHHALSGCLDTGRPAGR